MKRYSLLGVSSVCMLAPRGFGSRSYAFLNFISHDFAASALEALNRKRPAVPEVGDAPLEVEWAKGNQGLESLVNRYRAVVFSSGGRAVYNIQQSFGQKDESTAQ